MKSFITLIAIFSFSFNAKTKTFSQSFKSISLNKNQQLCFIVSKETNVRFYVLYASKDGSNYEIFDRIPSKGNSMLPQSYTYQVKGIAPKNIYIAQIDMEGNISKSEILKNDVQKIKFEQRTANGDNESIANTYSKD